MIRVKFCLECVIVDLNLIIKYYFVRKKLFLVTYIAYHNFLLQTRSTRWSDLDGRVPAWYARDRLLCQAYILLWKMFRTSADSKNTSSPCQLLAK